MIKNLNDIISLIALIILTVLSIRLFIGSLFRNDEDQDSKLTRREILLDYLNNEEE